MPGINPVREWFQKYRHKEVQVPCKVDSIERCAPLECGNETEQEY
jgi:hypothetical protein